jgi:hypothetical protein
LSKASLPELSNLKVLNRWGLVIPNRRFLLATSLLF